MPEYKDDKLFTALLRNNADEITRLKAQGVKLSPIVIYSLSTDKNKVTPSREEWDLITLIQFNFCAKMQGADEKDFIDTARRFRKELGAPIIYFKSIFKSGVPKHINSAPFLKCVVECFDTMQINKKKLMQSFIDSDRTDLLEVCINGGWLSQPKKRDELTEYAAVSKRPECTSFLLDFKNRTADLPAERAKAEKKEERELNAAPDSVTAMKRLWGFKKQENGSLSITGYKGERTEVSVPERIGKNIVTAVDEGAFCPFARRAKSEAARIRESITKITLPDTIAHIGKGAFWNCKSLLSVNIPKGVERICENTFAECRKLEKITVPAGVRVIERRGFYSCDMLKFIELPEGVESVGDLAFALCIGLITIVLPSTVKSIGDNILGMGSKRGSFVGAVVAEGSYAEKYCERNNIPFSHKLAKITRGSNSEEYCKNRNIPYIYEESKNR